MDSLSYAEVKWIRTLLLQVKSPCNAIALRSLLTIMALVSVVTSYVCVKVIRTHLYIYSAVSRVLESGYLYQNVCVGNA